MSAFSRAAVCVVQLFGATCLLLVASDAGYAGDIKAGHTKALMCQACHGLDGLSKVPDALGAVVKKPHDSIPYAGQGDQRVAKAGEARRPTSWTPRARL